METGGGAYKYRDQGKSLNNGIPVLLQKDLMSGRVEYRVREKVTLESADHLEDYLGIQL